MTTSKEKFSGILLIFIGAIFLTFSIPSSGKMITQESPLYVGEKTRPYLYGIGIVLILVGLFISIKGD